MELSLGRHAELVGKLTVRAGVALDVNRLLQIARQCVARSLTTASADGTSRARVPAAAYVVTGALDVFGAAH